MEYTIPLALTDFIPVIFSGLGLFLLAKMSSYVETPISRLAYTGAGLVTLGGLLKAIWKLIMASSGTDIAWMANALFILMGPGFTLMAWAMWCCQRVVQNKNRPAQLWAIPLTVILLVGGLALFTAVRTPEARTWNFIMLGLTTVGNVIVSAIVIVFAWKQNMKFVAFLFVVNLVAVFTLSGLARIPTQTIALQWTEESINSISGIAFAFAAWKCAQRISTLPRAVAATASV
jgi:hypothetical protein